ncbi:hypothetical protein BBJ28_00018988, partial [Nothophytophthora sp. Chile5]
SRDASAQLLASSYRSLLALPSSQELASALALTASQLAPAYDGVELRFGSKSFARFLGQLETETEDEAHSESLEKLLTTYPDYGLATQALLESGRIQLPPTEDDEAKVGPLSIASVHAKLLAIAQDEGVGGHQTLRIGMGEKSILAALAMASYPLRETPKEEEDRENSTTPASSSQKDWVECVTLAYAQHPSYSALAELLHANQRELQVGEKIRWLRTEARPAAGVPVLTMSAYPVSSVAAVLDRVAKSESRTATCEYKYDGARVQVHLSTNEESSRSVRRIFSRNMEDVTEKYASLLDVLQPQVAKRNSRRQGAAVGSSWILEGEVVALDRSTGTFHPFQVLQTKTTTEFCLFVFDLLALDGDNLLQVRLTKENGDGNEQEPKELAVVRGFLEQAVARGCEGLMVKTLDDESDYKAGRRSYSWVKLKHDYLSDESSSTTASSKRDPTAKSMSGNGTFLADTLDLVPIGAFYGKGRRAGVFGSFLMAAYNSTSGKFETIGKVGTGFSDAQLSEVTTRLRSQTLPETDAVPESYRSHPIRSRHPDVWLPPVEVWEIKATQLTESPSYTCSAAVSDADTPARAATSVQKGLALRFPRFVRCRPDKKPMQATESDQVLELFQQQTRH